MPPLLALVGRPNVGKSTLFNRVVGKRLAIVEDTPGVTRDRQYADAEHDGRHFRVVDTGGFTPSSNEQLVKAVREQALTAIAEADAIILVVDALGGLASSDRDLAELLRRGGKPVFIAANKMDSQKREGEADLAEIHALGLPVFTVSAEHGRGISELLEAALAKMPGEKDIAQGKERQFQRPLPGHDQSSRGRLRRSDARKAGLEAGGAGLVADVGDQDADVGADARDDWPPASSPQPPDEDEDLEDDHDALEPGPIHLAVLGRPNVGKSTLLNRLIGEERFVASAMPGTTRDAVDETIEHKGRAFVLTDTAGLRKKRQVVDKVEVFSAQRALRAVEQADVVVVLTDASELGVEQDARIAALAEERGRAVILCVNKWDLVKDKERESARLKEEAARHLQHVGFAPLLFISALEGTRVDKILDLAAELHEEGARRLPTPELNSWVQTMQDEHPAPLWNGFPVRFSYAYQVARQPITIAIQTNRPQAVDDAYRRFLLHRLRERFQLRVPVRLLFKQKSRSQPRGQKPRGRE